MDQLRQSPIVAPDADCAGVVIATGTAVAGIGLAAPLVDNGRKLAMTLNASGLRSPIWLISAVAEVRIAMGLLRAACVHAAM
jgi:hypothetical protein